MIGLSLASGLFLAIGFFSGRRKQLPSFFNFLIPVIIVTAIAVVALSPNEFLSKLVSKFTQEKSLSIAEHIPVDLGLLWTFYGPMLLFTPVGVWSLLRSRDSSFEKIFVVCFLLVWLGIWVTTSDFGYLVCSLIPLLIAVGIHSLLRLPESHRFHLGGRVTIGCSVLASVLLVWPMKNMASPYFSHREASRLLITTPAWGEATQWISNNTNPPLPASVFPTEPWKRREGFTYPASAYGILAHWQYGNLINARTRRIVVASRFSRGEFVSWFFSQSEEESLDRLTSLGTIRYVVLDATTSTESLPGEWLLNGGDLEELQVVEEATNATSGLALSSYGQLFRKSIGANLFLTEEPKFANYRLVFESENKSFLRYRALEEGGAVELRADPILNEAHLAEVEKLAENGASWFEGEYFCYSGDIVSSIRIFEVVRETP